MRDVTEAGGEFPDTRQLMAYGELSFLFLRSDSHTKLPLHLLRSSIQPAIDSGQFAIMRQDTVPRACLTWALLTQDAEDRVLSGAGLGPADWSAGARLWIMDIVAPYGEGTGGKMLTWFRDGLPAQHTEFRYARIGRDRQVRCFTVRRRPNGRWGSTVRTLMRPKTLRD